MRERGPHFIYTHGMDGGISGQSLVTKIYGLNTITLHDNYRHTTKPKFSNYIQCIVASAIMLIFDQHLYLYVLAGTNSVSFWSGSSIWGRNLRCSSEQAKTQDISILPHALSILIS